MVRVGTRRIVILPDAVANQIAAGEVVERPASVVKELLENALDAGARHVRIELEQGGKTLVVVSDDGSGMTREDAILSLDRHATSKIATTADLVGVATFGFRGEALPAIASVSRLTLLTSDGAGEGTALTVVGGRVEHVAAAVRQRGTTVTVRGLFYNTPARRKFLRSVSSETRAAWDAVSVLALSHPDAGFELVIDGTPRMQVGPDENEATRLAAVWGSDLAATMVPLHYGVGSVLVQGVVQRPADATPTGRRAQLFVNGRPFRDPFLVRAAEAGYRSAIHPGDRPSLLLHLTVPPEDVDVNVHPAKLEVRFRDRIAVERVAEEAVRHALGGLAAAAVVTSFPFSPTGDCPPSGGASAPWSAGAVVPDVLLPLTVARDSQPDAERQAELRAFAAPILQLFETYIAFESPEGVVLVDQHSAHERVLYETILRDLRRGGASGQRLLLPVTLELTDEELDVVEGYREAITSVGYEVEPFGGRSVVLQAVPAPHPRFDAARCFRELVADLARGRFGGWANRLERFAATYACRAAVKAGMRLSDPEMRTLLLRLFETALPPHDVHGRSTIIRLPRDELERRFGRR